MPPHKIKAMTEVGIDMTNRDSFKAEARWQRCCAVCGGTGAFQAHHVIYEQELKRRGLPKYDTRNSLRLCPDCHASHHRGRRRVKTRELTPDNIGYVIYCLGGYGADYLRRYYDDTEHDARIDEQLELLDAA